ncbi:DUF2058 domain-containing protein [Salinimonas chungwhensis]|uniref:DUF2058 domain-containing protein n=1 Tax=Salinimonas chungwhensis TaxID=265425 RepID=UPI00036E4FD5|nr:DUF2058 domain-containing protein [Salinimonas chungwhensis]
MASLQDQLLKAGLADKSSARQARQEKRKKQKLKNKNKQQVEDENKQAAQQAIEEKKARDRALNEEQQKAREERSIVAQVRQLITINSQPKGKDDVVLNFTDDNVVKRLRVSETVRTQVTQGRLAVVKLDEEYHLVPMPVADKIAERDESSVIYRADVLENESQSAAEDDWYAEYEIPDDLTW